MRLTPSDTDTYRVITIALVILVAAVSVTLAAVGWDGKSTEIREGLGERSQMVAAALDPDNIMQLEGKPSDERLQAYDDLKTQLAAIKKPDPTIRSIYLAGERDGRLFFYVDSEQPDSDDYSPAGEWYDDATLEFKEMFTTGQPVVEGPVTDEYGTFISGLAPIFVRPGAHRVVAVIGMDIEASTYWRNVIQAAAIPLLAGTSLIMVIGIFEWIRRRNNQLMNLRSELVSVASHELRNPITGIRWASENLQRLVQEPKAAPMVKAIHDSALLLQASTDDILELSHAMHQPQTSQATCDLAAIMREVIQTQMLSAQQKKVAIITDLSWPATLTLSCDSSKIKRALHNVLSNAIKYTKPGTTVTIAYRQDEKLHHILIHDEGIGIPATEQEKVFKGFYRASNAVASQIPGTGLGLFLVKTVFEQHGGSVSFTSEENKGTNFDLALPKQN